MNVVIPMGGLGKRFSDQGYTFPKPLVNIAGRPILFWILDHLSLNEKEDTLWLVLPEELDRTFQLTRRVKKEFPRFQIRTVPLGFQTRGAAETLFVCLQAMNSQEQEKPLISLDCDTIYFEDILEKWRNLNLPNASFYFEDKGASPLFSYLELDPTTFQIKNIMEKVKISNWANTGAYAFSSGTLLKEYCEQVLDEAVGVSGEYYTSCILQRMILKDENIKGILVKDFSCVGTPAQLKNFLSRKVKSKKATRFGVFLEGTLVDITTGEARQDQVNLIRELFDAGHTIVILSSMSRWATLEIIMKLGLPWHEVHADMPSIDLIVDNTAVNIFQAPKEVGWEMANETTTTPEKQQGFIPARAHNQIQFIGEDKIVKSSESNAIEGEVYWYEHIPDSIRDLFPQFHGVKRMMIGTSLTIARVHGVVLSHLFTHNSLTPQRLLKFFDNLTRIHQSCENFTKVDVYQLYLSKLEERFPAEFFFQTPVHALFQRVKTQLENYQRENGALVGPMHGDPVFTNVLLTPECKFVFIDMRGICGKEKTIFGDVHYDWAKVLQSLLGYDFVIAEKIPPPNPMLLETFKTWGQKNLSPLAQKYLGVLTASLYLSLLPFHVKSLWPAFIELAEKAETFSF